ncbi:substrate-binding domain-containing protein [Streptomyces sp. NPDC008079]|uniref:substrate-binding domain-containing protein n=1 Tax=Streptomyces sp. NPDC008079 TaxID=3364806 RepID=UPI0036E90368
MSSHAYDPRGKANRALLFGVYRYDHLDDLPGVRHNLGQLVETLMAGGVFGANEVRQVLPRTQLEFLSHLENEAKAAEGLFLLYFAGHGGVDRNGDNFHLLVGESRRIGRDDYAEAVSWSSHVLPRLRDIAERRLVDRIVVILDCCYAGNALLEFKPGTLHRGRDRISVLTAVQINRRIPGGNGHEPTPYTKQLIRLLRDGLPRTDEDVGPEEAARIELIPLSAALYEAMRHKFTEGGDDPWVPRHHAAESRQDVLLGLSPRLLEEIDRRNAAGRAAWWRAALAAAGIGAGAGRTGRGRRGERGSRGDRGGRGERGSRGERGRPGEREQRKGRPRKESSGTAGPGKGHNPKVLIPLFTAFAVLLAGGGYGVYTWAGGSTACAPPVELRLLTDPDAAPTVKKAVAAYLTSGANHTGSGCRRSGISLVDPKSADAVTGFQHAADWRTPRSTGELRPQRDIGAQPDIWIPGSDVTLARAKSLVGKGDDVELGSLGPVAYTPVVLAIPTTLASTPASVTGTPLGQLLDQLKRNNPKTVPVLRADPESTDSAQLATVGVYGQNGVAPVSDAVVGQFERQAAQLRPAQPDSYALMCALAGADPELKDNAAVLVPEQVMTQFNTHADAKARVGCDNNRLHPRAPQYPADVAPLDLPFVHVTWKGADRDATARKDAVDRFHTWLTGAAGQKVFTDDGYRTVGGATGTTSGSASGTATDTGSGAVVPGSTVMPGTYPPDAQWLARYAAAVGSALDRYRHALGPGRVLYLLDKSSSMDTYWSNSAGALDLLSQSLDTFGPDDAYGVWTVVDKPPTQQLVPLGRHSDLAGIRREVKATKLVDEESYPGPALDAALTEMTEHQKATGGAQLIVYITDDEDDEHFKGRDLPDLLARIAARPVPVEWVSLAPGGGCAAGSVGAQIARTSGGRCLNASSSQVSELRDDVARAGTGNAR